MCSDFSEQQVKTLSSLLQREFAKQETGLLTKVETMIVEMLQPMRADVASVKQETRLMKARILQLETCARGNCVEILNFPKEPQFDVIELVQKISTVVGCKMAASDIISAHRMKKVKPVDGIETQGILATLASQKLATEFANAAAKRSKSAEGLKASLISKKCSPADFSVYRSIPPEMKKLRWLAMRKKDALKYQFCWIASGSGKLLMKKAEGDNPIWIQTEEDLEKLR